MRGDVRPRLVDGQQTFAGGVNTVADWTAVGEAQVREARNMRLTDFGALTVRPGVASTATYPSAIQGGFVWNRGASPAQHLVVAGGALYVDGVEELTGLAAGPVTFASFRNGSDDVVYVADGGRLIEWDGTAAARASSGPDVRIIRVHNQRLWACGTGAFSRNLMYSGLNDGSSLADTGSGGGEIIVRTFGDEALVSLASIGGSLLIFHRRGISRLSGFGQDDTSVQPEGVSSDTGNICPYAIVESDIAVYFVTSRGVYAANESGVAPVGGPQNPDPIWPLVSTLTTPAEFDAVRAVHAMQSQEILFFVPGYGTYSYHTTLRAWTGPWDGPFLAATAMWDGSDSGRFFVEVGTDTGDVCLLDTSSITVSDRDEWSGADDPVDGDLVPWAVLMRRFHFADEAMRKAFRWGYLTAFAPPQKDILVEWTGDGAAGSHVIRDVGGVWDDPQLTWDSGVTWGVFGSKSYRIPMGGTGGYVDVRVSSVQGGTTTLSRFSLEAFGLARR